MFWGNFFEKFHAQCSMEGRVFENFLKYQKAFKIPKMPKIVPKSIQTCFELVLGQFLRKFFCPVFHGRSSLRKFSKKIKKFAKFQKCPKSFSKVSKRVLNLFWVKFFEIFFCPMFRGGSRLPKISKKNQKVFKFPKMSKIVRKRIQTCFERVLGQFFRKNFAQFSMEGRVFKNFQKKYFQNSKNAQKCSQKNPNVF